MAPPKNILLIDDDDDDQEIFLAALKHISGSIKFSGENNASHALDKLSGRLLSPDLIFLDLNMPVMNGRQFLKEIKQRETLRNIPVVIFTTSAVAATIRETKDMGASGFITKPDTLDDLVAILKTYIQ